MPLDAWSEFFVAGAGASAALAGLIIVAMSVNVDLIITIPGMTSRAAAAIALLVISTIALLAGLIPQGLLAYGIEVLVLGAAALFFAVDSMVKVLRARGEASLGQAVTKTVVGVIPGAALLVGGAVLAAGSPEGAIGVAVGTLGAIAVSVINAWVVLVEIKR